MLVYFKIFVIFFFLLGLNFLLMICLIIGILILINFFIVVSGEGGYSVVFEVFSIEVVYRGVRGVLEED